MEKQCKANSSKGLYILAKRLIKTNDRTICSRYGVLISNKALFVQNLMCMANAKIEGFFNILHCRSRIDQAHSQNNLPM